MVNDPNTYSERIQRVVDYLAGHLDEHLDLATVAGVAFLSPYHFHRIYRGLLGETVNDTVRRLRLQRAAIDLLDRDLGVERIAQRAGYASQAAFTRAFRDEYGEPPARYRIARREAQAKAERNPALYQVEIRTLPAVRVAAIEQCGDYQLASKAFERLMTVAATTGLLRPDTRTIGIFHDDPESVPQAQLRSAACITVPGDWRPTGELTEAYIEGGRYARIVHTGPYTELKTAYDWLYQTWLATSTEEPRNLPCVEEYLNDPRQVSAKDLETAVMMPLIG
jgi:AraC family transcriptional regulator